MVALSLFEPRTLFAAAAAFAAAAFAASFAVLSTAFAPPYRHPSSPRPVFFPRSLHSLLYITSVVSSACACSIWMLALLEALHL
jgi:hypothetical protein